MNAFPQSSSFTIELLDEILDLVLSFDKQEDSLGIYFFFILFYHLHNQQEI